MKVKRKEKVLKEVKLGLNSLSAHGFGYFFAEESSIFERLFWIITTFIMIGISISWINTVFVYWGNNPVLLETVSTSYPIKNIKEFFTISKVKPLECSKLPHTVNYGVFNLPIRAFKSFYSSFFGNSNESQL